MLPGSLPNAAGSPPGATQGSPPHSTPLPPLRETGPLLAAMYQNGRSAPFGDMRYGYDRPPPGRHVSKREICPFRGYALWGEGWLGGFDEGGQYFVGEGLYLAEARGPGDVLVIVGAANLCEL
jgi:hypothetical protein